MNKLETFLERIYNNSANPSLYFYIIIGGIALIIILVIIYASIKPKEEIKEDKSLKEDDEKEKAPLLTNEVKEEDPKVEEPIIKEKPLENKELKPEEEKVKPETFSSVYLDIKPLKKEETIENIKPKEEPKTDFAKEEAKEEVKSEPTKKIDDLSINPDMFKEKEESLINTIPNLFEGLTKSKKEEVIEDIKEEAPIIDLGVKVESVKETKNDIPEMVVIEDIKEEKKPEIINEEEFQKEVKEEVINEEVNEELAVTPESIKAKLEALSKKSEKNENDLDDILKQVGIEETPELPKMKDEESVLLGK